MSYLNGNVCVFGDSIALGMFDLDKGGWANRLLLYSQEYLKYETFIYNLGIPGSNSSNLLNRLESECYTRTPDTIIIAIGINDSKYIKLSNVFEIQIEEFRNNIRKIIEISKRFTAKIVFIGLTKVNEKYTIPCMWNENYSFRNGGIIAYNNEIKNICNQKRIKFIDLICLLKDSDLSDDGVHPNSLGHEKMFNYIKNELI